MERTESEKNSIAREMWKNAKREGHDSKNLTTRGLVVEGAWRL
jgi:uncharacterized protein (UPF0335 family)